MRWLTRANFSVTDKLDLDTDPRGYLSRPSDLGIVGVRDLRSGHPLMDGAVFDLTSDSPATEVSFELLGLQWDLLRVAAMCGAAGAAGDPGWEPEVDLEHEDELGLQPSYGGVGDGWADESGV